MTDWKKKVKGGQVCSFIILFINLPDISATAQSKIVKEQT